MLHLQQLRVLLAVRDHRSLNAAAAAMGYGVPTIAHHLNALERHLRVTLVERDRRGARLTPLGEVLAVEADHVLARIDTAERLITTQRDRGLSTISVGTFASVGAQLLPAAIAELRSRRRVQVEILEAEPTEVVRRVLGGELHAGLIYDSADEPAFAAPDLELTLLLEEGYQVLAARPEADGGPGRVDLASLADAEWICSRDQNEASDRVLRRACLAAGFEPRVLMRTDDLNMIHGLVAEGLGRTLIVPSAIDHRFDVTALDVEQELGRRRTSFVCRRTSAPASIHELREILAREYDARRSDRR